MEEGESIKNNILEESAKISIVFSFKGISQRDSVYIKMDFSVDDF